MATTDLLFGRAPAAGQPVYLVFGDDGTATAPNADLSIAGTLPGPTGSVGVTVCVTAQVSSVLPSLTGTVAVTYNSDTQRPTVNDSTSRFQQATGQEGGRRMRWQQSQAYMAATLNRFEAARPQSSQTSAAWDAALSIQASPLARFQQATPSAISPARSRFQETWRTHGGGASRFDRGDGVGVAPVRVVYQETLRDRRNLAAARFANGKRYSRQVSETEAFGVRSSLTRSTRYQDARRPPIGISTITPVVPPTDDPCYLPPAGDAVELVFSDQTNGSPLVFVCERHNQGGTTVVVPVKEVYVTVNSAVLVRVDTGDQIPTTKMSMSIDVDSWTWAFQASVPGAALALISPDGDDPVVVQATINGTALRFVIESYSRDRKFGSSSLSIRGRGLSAELDAPYAASRSFGNSSGARSARQLLDDILTENGVPLAWAIDSFGPTDWNVPSGVFSHYGTYITAINAVAGAVGAYVQPHNTDRKLNVLLKYPTPSWTWADQTPDIILPSSVTTSEGIEWASKAAYNRVFVSGQDAGVLVRYTRDGTAGDLAADSVVDALITEAAAGRQRGRAILSDTGRVATVTVRLPVLAETGIIKPGRMVRYVDGSTLYQGLTRSVSLDVGLPTIYQTLTVQTYVN